MEPKSLQESFADRCFCRKRELSLEEASYVVNGVPCCNAECLSAAEARYMRSRRNASAPYQYA